MLITININLFAYIESFHEQILNRIWLYFSNHIIIMCIILFVIILGILLPNKANLIKSLNLISSYYLCIFFYFIKSDIIYNNSINTNVIFEQNFNLSLNFFILIATISTFLFLLSISDIFYLEENMKIEYSLLVLFIYISSIFLISSLDFISTIILLECIAFCSYILVGFERKNKFSTSSALKYLILASIPGGFFILGISLLYNSYGSFYQDYLQQLLISFDKYNVIKFDWWYTTQYYYTNDYFFNTKGYDLNINFYSNYLNGYLLHDLIDYIEEFDSLLKIFNPEIILCIYEMEIDINSIRDFLLVPLHLEKYYNKNLNNNYNIIQLEIFYIDFYSRFLYLMDKLLTVISLWEILNYVQGSIISNWNCNITNDIYMFLGNNDFLTKGILDWISFISYYNYDIENYHSTIDGKLLLNVFYSTKFQDANLLKLTKESFHHGFYWINECFFWNLVNTLSKSEYLLTRNTEYTIIQPWLYCIFNNIFYKNIFEFYNYFLEPHNFYYISNLDYKLEALDTNFILNYINYNNIFLTIYLVLFFILINLFFKITMAPFHFWAPSVYGGSPLPTITFLSIFSKLTIIFFLLNIFLTVFDNLKYIWQPIFFILSVLSIIISIIGAFSEKVFKRFFIYSSIGHVGFMVLGISVLNYEGIQGTIDYLIIYIISSFIIWFIVMYLTKKTTHLINFKGLSYNYPILSLILIIALFSISGLPPMAGFFVKFEIFNSLLNSSQYFIGYFLFLLTVISFFYYLRLIKIIYFENNKHIKKNKNFNDIKLRLIAFLILILPLYIIFIGESFFFLIEQSIIIFL
jgi:NADH:ubiquinone oxidoreductase subunit 2 (subunit N)